jgi:uncharacterized repeat protein (TIGR04138 family)
MSGPNFEQYSMKDFGEVVDLICQNDPRYERGAYFLVRRALDFTLEKMRKAKMKKTGTHVSGRELLEGMRSYVLDQYGPMSATLLQSYGLHAGEDVGQIVFNLVEYGVFGKTDQDSIEDFKNIYTFREAFEEPFEPSKGHSEGKVPGVKR